MAAAGIVLHLRNYASAGVLSAVVGLVSFPILTRSLSVAEYGIVGLITSSLTLFIAIGKLGVQHSVIRFFAQVKNANIDFSVGQLNSTVSLVFFCFACMTTALWLVTGLFILPNVLQYENISSLFMLASVIVFVRLLGSGAMNFLRAQQRSGDVAISQSLARFLNLCFVIAVLLLSTLDPVSVISCLLVAEVLGVSYAVYQYWPDFQFKTHDVSGRLVKALLVYGLPLMILESLSLVLRLSDRYLIESILGVSELGQYSASYNFASYIDIIVLATLIQAVKPAYMQLWEQDGKARTEEFLAKGFHLFLVLGIPFITMFSITSPHVLSFLAGEKYAPGTIIIPFVAFSFLLEGAVHFLAAGLYIFKNTKILMIWSLIATVINLVLNVLLIPRFGIAGAAIVTLISYAVFMVGVSILGFRHVSFPVSMRTPVLMSLASAFVFAVVNPLSLGPDMASFLIKGFAGTSVLLLFMWLIDPMVRQWLGERTARFIRREAKL